MEMLTKRTIKLKLGKELPVGCSVTWSSGTAMVHDGTQQYRISALGAARALGIPEPSHEELKQWSYDGVCVSVLGETVEPDGMDEHGSPSWLLVYGLL